MSAGIVTAVLMLPLLHYLADFEAQWDWLAIEKSKRWDALAIHVGIYSVVFALVFGVWFGAITFVTHFLTDAITSRWTSKLWFIKMFPGMSKESGIYILMPTRHRFFCAVGLDQMIHQYTLLLTAWYLNAYPWFL